MITKQPIVSNKLEEIAADNGSLTRGSVESIMKAEFETMRQTMESNIHTTIKDSLESAGFKISCQEDESGNAITSNTTSNVSQVDGSPIYQYDGKFYFVPKGFLFPDDVKRKTAWRFWLIGMSFRNNEKVRPLRLFKTSSGFPTHELKTQFNTEYKPILSLMQQAPGMNIPSDLKDITDSVIESTYNLGTEHLKSVVSYVWSKGWDHESWTVGTWSNKTRPNKVKQYGSESDIAALPNQTYRNNCHATKRTLKTKPSARRNKKARTSSSAS